MNVEKARAILAQGKKDGTYEAPVPEDDGKAISEAVALVEMAQTAWDQHVRGDEVKALLRLADDDFDGSNGDTPKQQQKLAPKSDPEPEPTPEPEQEPQAETSTDDLANTEPWEDYDKDRVSEIKEGINAAIRDYPEQELAALLGNIWMYEEAHKNRERILKYLEKIAIAMSNGEDPLADQKPPEPTPDPEPAPEPEAEAEPAPPPHAVPSSEHADEVEDMPEDEAPPAEVTSDDESDVMQSDPDIEQNGVEAKTEEDGQTLDEQTEAAVERVRDESEPNPEQYPDEEPESSDYGQLVEHVNEELKQERIHIPAEPETELPELPMDWTKMSDGDLQKFHGAYSAAAYYKAFQLSKDERMASRCKQAADELHNALLVATDKYDQNGKEKRVAVLEAEIESDENVKKWRRQQRKHEIYAAAHRNERDSISKLVEALSRHATLRHDEWERAGGKTGRGR